MVTQPLVAATGDRAQCSGDSLAGWQILLKRARSEPTAAHSDWLRTSGRLRTVGCVRCGDQFTHHPRDATHLFGACGESAVDEHTVTVAASVVVCHQLRCLGSTRTSPLLMVRSC